MAMLTSQKDREPQEYRAKVHYKYLPFMYDLRSL